LNRGQHLQEILKQPQYAPVSLENQVITLFAATNGYSDAVPLERVRAWESDLLRYMETSHPEIGKDIGEMKRITDENQAALHEAIKIFTSTWIA